jgi:hypothetical protein
LRKSQFQSSSNELIVKYQSTRAEVWRAYVYAWRHSLLLKVSQLLLFAITFIAARSWLQTAGIYGASQVVAAATISIAVILAIAAYPQLRYKAEERTLAIGATGISTTIGHRSGDVPWTKIARITPTSEAVHVVGTSGNIFRVPDRAFSSPAQRDEFVARATQFMKDSRER